MELSISELSQKERNIFSNIIEPDLNTFYLIFASIGLFCLAGTIVMDATYTINIYDSIAHPYHFLPII
jgi:hypothetical protein